MRFGWTSLVLLVGCSGPTTSYEGFNMDKFFPFDGERTWEYVNDDPSIAYHVVATLDSQYRELEGGSQRVYTITYAIECFATDPECVTGDPFRVRAIELSSDQSYGTVLHSVDMADTGLEALDPTVMITGTQGKGGDVWTSESGGVTWMSRFEGIGLCDVPYTPEWDECLTLQIDDDDDASTDPAAHPLHGWWTAVPGYNLIAFQWRDDPQPWRLLNQSFTAPE